MVEQNEKDRLGAVVDFETRRKKQQAMMVQLVERKVRSRAKQLYETRGQGEGQALQDWFQAESEVLDDTAVAPLYRRVKANANSNEAGSSTHELVTQDSSACESNA